MKNYGDETTKHIGVCEECEEKKIVRWHLTTEQEETEVCDECYLQGRKITTDVDDSSLNEISAYVKKLIFAKGYKSIRKFAKDTGLPVSTITNALQKNTFQNCSIKILAKVCRTLEISPDFILKNDAELSAEQNENTRIVEQKQKQEEREQELQTLKITIKEQELLERELALIAREEKLLRREKDIVLKELGTNPMLHK